MFVWRRWIAKHKGKGLLPKRKTYYKEARFEGLFLFGFIPLYVRQIEDWQP